LVGPLQQSFGLLHTAYQDRLVGVCLEQNPPPVCFAFPRAADGTSYATHLETSLRVEGSPSRSFILKVLLSPWVSPHACA
jgi:hypothetical protein